MYTLNLTNCDLEPIHIPGKIQGHGFFLAIDSLSNIQFCSENIYEFIPVYARDILNKPVLCLEKYFQKEDRPEFFSWIIETVKNKVILNNPYLLSANNKQYNLIIIPSGEYYFFEFEPVGSKSNADFYRLASQSLSLILAKKQIQALLFKSCEEIRKIIEFDRVMIYKFYDDGHGEVIAEDKINSLNPFMGLRFPASDIPKQARELYKINPIRMIADVQSTPSNLMTQSTDRPLDLTMAGLRAVSPIHIEYLKNLNAASSFSISLFDQNKLWGLIACHNILPNFITYPAREAISLIGEVISLTLGSYLEAEDQQKKDKLRSAVEVISKHLLLSGTIYEALFENNVTILDAVNASGAALILDNKLFTIGDTPDEAFISDLINWLNENIEDQLYVTNRLPYEYPPALSVKEICSGILALKLSKEDNNYLLWMRPELISMVKWAGDPHKPVEINNDQHLQLTPRKSFETWSQTVLNTSENWGNEDVNSALQLKEEISSTMVRKAVEVRKTNEKLNEAYATLDAFSHTISHDLKTPLTIINAYAQLLRDDLGANTVAQSLVSGILSGTHKMELMIRNILHYSQIGQSDVKRVKLNMANLLREIKDDLLLIYGEKMPRIIINNTPDIYADETMSMQVFANLLTNALKYSSKVANPLVVIEGIENGAEVEYSVSDNGIGVNEADQNKIFDLFTRASNVNAFEGSGVGLSIVKRIMEKHNGQIWVESNGKSGSVFFVTFGKSDN